jgi:ankyrin repeat protein
MLTPFLQACRNGSIDKVKELFDSELANEALYQACIGNQLDIVDYLLTDPILVNSNTSSNIHALMDLALQLACKSNSLSIVQFLLESPKLIDKAHLYETKNSAFTKACEEGHIEIVEYLLKYDATSQKKLNPYEAVLAAIEYKKNDFIMHFLNKIDNQSYYEEFANTILIHACKFGNFPLVQYALTSPTVNIPANIHYSGDLAIRNSAENNHEEITLYLFSSSDLQEHANVNPNKIRSSLNEHIVLKHIINNFMKPCIDYIFIEKNIEVDSSLNAFLHESTEGCQYTLKLLKARNLNYSLEQNLSSNSKPSKKLKI